MGAKQKGARIFTKTIPFRKDFYRAAKEPYESAEQWLFRVKELAKTCGFGQNNDLFVFNKFITSLENELTDYLCSNAQCLDINSSQQLARLYEKQNQNKTEQNETINTSFVDQSEPLLEPPETVCCSNIVKKCGRKIRAIDPD